MSSSKFTNNIAISITDDDSDELLQGRRTARARRKRKKLGFRARNSVLKRAFRNLMRYYWVVLMFIGGVVFFFEGVKIFGKSGGISNEGAITKMAVEKKAEGNLNRLDRTTRMFNGARELCLKLQPPEALEHLDIPAVKEPYFPVNRVIYKSDDDTNNIEGDATIFERNGEATRFNLFTGNQTIREREQSFKVNGTAVVHCGFYSEKGGFKLSEEDKSYMQTCKVVVSTCTFGGGDDLYQPIGMSQASLEKVCYVAFWDEITLATQEADGKKINVDRMIGKWHIVIVRDLPFTDQRLNGKIPKMLTHRLFPQARFSIWVDSKSQFRRDPLGVLEALLWRTNSILAISEHGARSSVYDEAKAVVHKNKAAPEEVDRQMTQYLHDGFPDDKRFYGKKALAEASIIVKEHTPLTNLFMCLWFNEVVRFTSRDQLSFPYVHRRLRLKRINMFHVCTRKDLVNSIGHKRKAKPLIS